MEWRPSFLVCEQCAWRVRKQERFDGSLLLAGSDIFSLSTFEKLATMESVWEWGKQERPGAPFFGFTGPAGFIADGSAVAYINLSPGSCCLVNVPDGTMRWCWVKGQLVKEGED